MNAFLKCDAPGCDHRENHETLDASMVDKPCPKCGANLLTQADYDVWVALLPQFELLKSLGVLVDAPVGTPPEHAVSFNYHDGRMNISAPLTTP